MPLSEFTVPQFAFLAVLFPIASSIFFDRPSVTLKDGTALMGVYQEFHSDELPAHGMVERFAGIPYAKPPIGALRFKPPVPYGPLASPFDATKIGSSCSQMLVMPLVNTEISEDCLFLDVFVPHPKPDNAPVVFSIHDGAYTFGAGNIENGPGSMIPPVIYGDVIVVKFNYRLGPFGFFYSGDGVIPGNMGLMDQQLALKWVNENIQAFGGDPSAVTLAGFSSGSASVGFHVLSPGSRGLFRYGIMESGSPFDVWNGFRSAEVGATGTEDVARSLGCREEEIADSQKRLECMQRVTAGEILRKYIQVISLSNIDTHLAGPVVDGTFLPDAPAVMIEKEALNGESLIISTTAEEGTVFLAMQSPNSDTKPVIHSTMFASWISSFGAEMNEEPLVLDLVKTIYASDPGVRRDDTEEKDFFHEVAQFLTDKFFMCSASEFARKLSEKMSVYRCTMTFRPSYSKVRSNWTGASHGAQTPFTWAAVFGEENTHTDEEKDLSRLALNYLLNFIKTGDPNNGGGVCGTSPEWRQFTREDEIFKDLTPEMGDTYMRRRECYFHDNILPRLHQVIGGSKFQL